ncbi:MAG TPA: hypothetical protein VFB72_14675 [Verrucomicrobiae bacterium]|nr:hypothetical protein [Verrucomicrobiae bacterium]
MEVGDTAALESCATVFSHFDATHLALLELKSSSFIIVAREALEPFCLGGCLDSCFAALLILSI